MMMMMINSSKDLKNLQSQPTHTLNMFIKRPLNNHVHKSVLVVIDTAAVKFHMKTSTDLIH
jgi:hypothetical protein